ncbi:uncharacterized protein LOC114260529 [Camellia sinensis]|uniref:uncharacterized protein LOC114260529 n=1 Tax=Camellia sinensis TaxID=4442 RepID=UPI001035CCFB|nr:uncharacterized protein LOC114260529 [Camellia sinensis]
MEEVVEQGENWHIRENRHCYTKQHQDTGGCEHIRDLASWKALAHLQTLRKGSKAYKAYNQTLVGLSRARRLAYGQSIKIQLFAALPVNHELEATFLDGNGRETECSTTWDIKATPAFFFFRDGQQVQKLVRANKPDLQACGTVIMNSMATSNK